MARESLLDQRQTLQMVAAVERQYSSKRLKIWVQAMIPSLINYLYNQEELLELF